MFIVWVLSESPKWVTFMKKYLFRNLDFYFKSQMFHIFPLLCLGWKELLLYFACSCFYLTNKPTILMKHIIVLHSHPYLSTWEFNSFYKKEWRNLYLFLKILSQELNKLKKSHSLFIAYAIQSFKEQSNVSISAANDFIVCQWIHPNIFLCFSILRVSGKSAKSDLSAFVFIWWI